MNLCMVYNLKDSKLRPESYCSIFKEMFDALITQFNCRQFITENCSAKDIDADLILFFDPHSSHHIEIEGIEKHQAIKIEYWNDVHQQEVKGIYQTTNQYVHKLGREQRARRAEKRGINFIVCPVKYKFYEYFTPYFGSDTEKMLLYFPYAPAFERNLISFSDRKRVILGNGATWGGFNGGYDFRKWCFEQPYIEFVEHHIRDKNTPKSQCYKMFLSQYVAALALCTTFPVPKYYEIPASGCVTFAEYHKEYEELGFKDYESCIYVNQKNFGARINEFLADILSFQKIADAGKKLIEENYTARHFSDFLEKSIKDRKERGSHEEAFWQD